MSVLTTPHHQHNPSYDSNNTSAFKAIETPKSLFSPTVVHQKNLTFNPNTEQKDLIFSP